MPPSTPDRPRGKSLKPLASLIPFIKPYFGTLVLAGLFLLVAAAAQLTLPVAFKRLIDDGMALRDATTINHYFVLFLGAAIVFGLFAALRFYMISWMGERVVADIRSAVYARIVRMDPTFFEVTKTGEVLSRLTTDTTLVQTVVGSSISMALRSIITLMGALVMLMITSASLTMAFVALLPIIVGPMLIMGRRVRKLSRASQDRIADTSALADESLNAIQNLLNEANIDLKGNTANLPFSTTLYNNKASEFSKFNRALAARVAVYRQDWGTASTALSESFLGLTPDSSLRSGVYYLFSTGGGDLLNPVFFPTNTPAAEVRVTQPNWITDATPGDSRLTKAPKRLTTATQDGLNSDYDFFVYTTNVAPIPVIRNEELVLLYAEVKVQQSLFPDALVAINRIRTAYGLSAYAGAVTKDALITEILNQRRYSLFGEGHRWIDMRRYNLLNTLPIDRAGDDVWQQFPIPATEAQQ